MKRVVTFIMLIIFYSCSSDDSALEKIALTNQNIVGTWQINGRKVSAGGSLPKEFNPIEEGTILIFELDGTYKNVTHASEELISAGKFSFSESSLELLPETEEGDAVEKRSYDITLYENEMVVFPTGPLVCTEGCLFRYIRVE